MGKKNLFLICGLNFLMSINTATAEQLNTMNYEEFMAVADLPPEKVTDETLRNAWKFVQDDKLITAKRIIFADWLGPTGTVDFIPKFIDFYYKARDTELKSALVKSTEVMYQKYFQRGKFEHERVALKKFYSDMLDNHNLTDLETNIVIRGFVTLNSTDVVLANQRRIQAAMDRNALAPDANFDLKIILALTSKELERIYIPDIVSVLNHTNNPDLEFLFDRFIMGRLSEKGMDSLQPESKRLVRLHLDAVKSKYDFSDRGVISNVKSYQYGAWLEVYALINSVSLRDAGKYIADFLKGKNSTVRGKYIIGFSNSDYLKSAFKNEPLLIRFKNEHNRVYRDTVGLKR